ncbi:hypothetical protein [Microbacterium alcoholitolerans]|uniref:hypothetical protein n=1 Tax=unclassified Microbacterium TaxID=2609290 RepID=UPI003D1710EA
MITSTLVMPVIAVSTLATVIFIGLGFLPRPSRPTAIWSAVFALAMIGSYAWLAQDFVYPDQLRALGSALVIAPMSLLWSGIRAYRGLHRQFVPLSIAVLVATPLFLIASTFFGFYGIAFRVVFCANAVLAVLSFLELIRLGPQLRDEALPLMGASAAFVVFAAITTINGVLVAGGTLHPADGLQFLHTITMTGTSVYGVCALVTTLLLTTRADVTAVSTHGSFERTARNRLNRARAANDQWWSLLDVRLDDPDDIRLASTTAALNAVTQKLACDIDSVLPADSDIERINPTCFLVLVPRPQGGVRELVTELLERISASEDERSFPIRVSASIGWAPVSAVGYDYGALVGAASDAAEKAYANGGDRWERVHAASE